MQRSNLQFCKTASTNFYEFLGMGPMKTESNTKQISRKKIVKKQDLKKKKNYPDFSIPKTLTHCKSGSLILTTLFIVLLQELGK